MITQKKIMVIPHFSGDYKRERNLAHVLAFYQKHLNNEWLIVVSEMGSYTELDKNIFHLHTTLKFSKATAWNIAIKHIKRNTESIEDTILCFMDNDIVLSKSYVERVLNSSDTMGDKRYIHPFKHICDLSITQTHDLIKNNLTESNQLDTDNKRLGERCYGGVSIAYLEDVCVIGGFVEFSSWGHEDDLFHYSMFRLVGSKNYSRGNEIILHLEHGISNTNDYLTSDSYLTQETIKLEGFRHLKKKPKDFWEMQRLKNGFMGFSNYDKFRISLP